MLRKNTSHNFVQYSVFSRPTLQISILDVCFFFTAHNTFMYLSKNKTTIGRAFYLLLGIGKNMLEERKLKIRCGQKTPIPHRCKHR